MKNAIIRTIINILIIKYGFTVFDNLNIEPINSAIALIIMLYFLVAINSESLSLFNNHSKKYKNKKLKKTF